MPCKRFVHLLLFFLLISISTAGAFADPDDIPPGFIEYTLANGLEVFILEDTSSAPVRIELSVRAGFSAQSRTTTGFFPLYTRLFSTAGKQSYYSDKTHTDLTWLLTRLDSSCNADSARYILTVSPEQTATALDELSQCASSPLFSDNDLNTAYTALKNDVMNTAFSTTGFINSSIDARIFSSAPWKHESGIYPALFSTMLPAQIRTILTSIERSWYIPQNSALFISGCISKKTALAFAERYFGSWQAEIKSPGNPFCYTNTVKNDNRKFILYDPSFSADITQVIIQYTSLSMPLADIAAASFNSNTSSFKNTVISKKDLSVRSTDYIDAAATHKNGSTRLIFQTLMEQSKLTPVEQIQLFTDEVRSAADIITPEELTDARQRLIADYKAQLNSSISYMDLLAQFWSVETTGTGSTELNCAEQLAERPKNVAEVDAQLLKETYDRENPFVFVLVNSAIFKKYQTAFQKAGYEPVSTVNGSWYTQELYKNLKAEENTPPTAEAPGQLSDFAAYNHSTFSSATLSNGIPIIMKQNHVSSTAVVSLVIAGGKLGCSENPGLNTVMTDALAENIQQEILARKQEGTIDSNPEILAETRLTDSIITIESSSADAPACIACISTALIYGDIKPSLADGLIYNRQTEKRTADGNPVNQLYSSAINKLYKDTSYPPVFATPADILKQTTYKEILAAYPLLLDPSRYTVIITGNFSANDIIDSLSGSLGLLAQIHKTENIQPLNAAVRTPVFPSVKKQTVKLRHVFLTDVSADKAGPMPEKLVPTKNFTDPVQYWLPSPPPDSTDFVLFNGLISELGRRMNETAASDPELAHYHTTVTPADSSVQTAVITVTNTERTSRADMLYKKAVKSLEDDLSNSLATKTTAEIRNDWIITSLSNTETNRGTALLILTGIERNNTGKIEENAEQYLSDYKTVSNTNAVQLDAVLTTWIPLQAPLALYSADSQR
jgi:predicted Zn-dependent peptidase